MALPLIALLVFGCLLLAALAGDGVNRDMHAFATDLILLDRMLERQSPPAEDARRHLRAYTERAVATRWIADDGRFISDQVAEHQLDEVGRALPAPRTGDEVQLGAWNEMRQIYRRVVERRWTLVEQAEGSIPVLLIFLVVSWLMMIFASFGYGAPKNTLVIGGLTIAAALIAGAIYLILEMDAPFSGPIHVSMEPLRRVLAEMQR